MSELLGNKVKELSACKTELAPLLWELLIEMLQRKLQTSHCS